jgi:hypothetical protein
VKITRINSPSGIRTRAEGQRVKKCPSEEYGAAPRVPKTGLDPDAQHFFKFGSRVRSKGDDRANQRGSVRGPAS